MPDDRFIHRKAGHGRKPNLLTDLEFRVWMQYLLSADDFGVMRGTHHPLQNDNDHLEHRPARVIQKCLDALVKVGLVRRFEHQGKPYVYQHDWQDWQKVAYPRTTNQPAPPADAVAECAASTRELFALHPGGARRKRGELSENVSEIVSEDSPPMRASVPAKRLTAKANGERLMANGSEGGLGETPPMDMWARELVDLYPAEGRCGANLVERPLFAALTSGQLAPTPAAAWDALKARLEQHKRSHQWRVKKMIKRADRWLSEGLYLAELPEQPMSTLVNERTERSLTSGAAFIAGGSDGTH